MTAYNGENYAKSIDPTADNKLDVAQAHGRVRIMQDIFSFGATALASTDTINMCNQLPTGAVILAVKLGFDTDAGSTSGNLSLGDQGSSTRYLAASGATTAAVRVGPDTNDGQNYEITGTTDNILRLTVTGAGTPTMSENILKLTVMYSID